MSAPEHGEFGGSSRAIEGAPSVPIVIRKHARRWPDKQALIFLDGSGKETAHMTYGTLVARVERLASGLRARGLHGQPVGLAFPPGLEFVQAFLACMRAGVIAVPLALPGRRDRRSASMGDLLTGAGAPALLATRSGSTPLEAIEEIAGAAKLALLLVEDLDGDDAPIPAPDTADVAFLQYTSGSTRKPKGVMVTQRNLLAMERMIQEMFQHDETSTFVGWLPIFMTKA
jgi:acyl-CoA synthetase (AMP-forming)/AMP-acid ligase II